ncbi:MAG: tetratricopeptide repeat protein, partial [Sphingobacteriaceae bacterium]
MYKALGFGYLMVGNYYNAQINYDHALQICLKGFGPTHPTLVSIYEHLAFFTCFQDPAKGIKYYTLAIKISNMHLDQRQPRLMNCYFNIAKLIIRFRNIKDAQLYLKKVLKIHKNSEKNQNLALQAQEKLMHWEKQQIYTDINYNL